MTPLPRPNLKPRRLLFWASLATFLIWLGLLAWIYVTQVYLKHR